MKTKQKPKTELGRAGSLKQAAAILNESIDVLKAAKAMGSPGFDDHGRIDCATVQTWLAAPKNRKLLAPLARKAEATARRAELIAERLEWQNEQDREKHVPRVEIHGLLMWIAGEQRRIFAEQFAELSKRLGGTPEIQAQVRALLAECAEEIPRMAERLANDWRPIDHPK